MQTNNITVPKVPEEAGGFWALGNTESVDDGLGGRAMNRKTFFYRDTQTVFFNYRVHRLTPEIFFFWESYEVCTRNQIDFHRPSNVGSMLT